jgi:hypothetical protein
MKLEMYAPSGCALQPINHLMDGSRVRGEDVLNYLRFFINDIIYT